LLITRPEPDGERSAAVLRARGHQVLAAPLSRIVPAAAGFGPGPWAALLISSANAVRALEIHPRRQELIGLPVLAVGGGSAAAARQAGFAHVTSADGTGADLARMAASRFSGAHRPLLYLAGADRAVDLAGLLGAAAVPVEMHVIYQAVAETVLPPAAAEALRRRALDGALHFSRRGAGIFLETATRAGLREAALALTHDCLSARVAEPLAAAGAANIRIAPHPTEESLLRQADLA
jgi:uroporphyrinogen-III synthase